MTVSSDVIKNSEISELSKAQQEILFLVRSLKVQQGLVKSTEKIIKSSLDIGASIWVQTGIRTKQKAIARIERITNQIMEAKKNLDLWTAIEEVHAHAQ